MEEEMTRYAFMSHMEDFMRELLRDPIRAKTDKFLNDFGIDGPVALKMLLKRTDPNDESSAILVRSERIKDNGVDDNGKRNKDTFEIKYKIPRKDFKKKLRNLYINLFENNIIDNSPLNEGAWGYGILDNDSALDLQTEFATVALKVLVSKLRHSMDNQNLWANIGVLVDFLKKYKDDEIQLTDEYNEAIETVKNFLTDILVTSNFAESWSEPDKFKTSVKKILKDVSLLKYQKEIMNVGNPEATPEAQSQRLNEDGEGACMDGMGGATNANDSSGQYTAVAFPQKRKGKNNESDVIKRKTMYITSEQAQYLKEVATTDAGDYQFTVPLGNPNNKFYKKACDHKNIMADAMPK